MHSRLRMGLPSCYFYDVVEGTGKDRSRRWLFRILRSSPSGEDQSSKAGPSFSLCPGGLAPACLQHNILHSAVPAQPCPSPRLTGSQAQFLCQTGPSACVLSTESPSELCQGLESSKSQGQNTKQFQVSPTLVLNVNIARLWDQAWPTRNWDTHFSALKCRFHLLHHSSLPRSPLFISH